MRSLYSEMWYALLRDMNNVGRVLTTPYELAGKLGITWRAAWVLLTQLERDHRVSVWSIASGYPVPRTGRTRDVKLVVDVPVGIAAFRNNDRTVN